MKITKKAIKEAAKFAIGIDYKASYKPRYHINPDSAASLRKADGRAEAKLIQIACGPAPDGRSRWTLKLLEEKARVELAMSVS